MSDFAWLIEAPGQNYLAAPPGHHRGEFRWVKDANLALRFFSQEQADLSAAAIRSLQPDLWGFARTLGEAWPREHGFLALHLEGDQTSSRSQPSADAQERSPGVMDLLEQAALLCEAEQETFLSDKYAIDQPFSSIGERLACRACAARIRELARTLSASPPVSVPLDEGSSYASRAAMGPGR